MAAAGATGIYETPLRRVGRALGSLWPSRHELSMTGHSALVQWGMVAMLLHFVMMFTPEPVQDKLRFAVWVNSFVWALTAFFTTRKTIRSSLPIVLFLVLQVWVVMTQMIASSALARDLVVGKHLFFPTEEMISFFVATGLVTLLPEVRKYALNIFLAIATISALVALMQFVNVGPALTISDYYLRDASIQNWGGVQGVRSSGLTTHPGIQAFVSSIALVALSTKWITRNVTFADAVLFGIFGAAAASSQVRSALPLMFVAIIVALAVLWRRSRPLFGLAFSMVMLFCIVVVTMASDRFAYIFETEWLQGGSFQTRVERWEASLDLAEQYPVFGIGPDPARFGSEGVYIDKYSGRLTESAYFSFLTMFGVPGLFILLIGFPAAYMLAAREFRIARSDSGRKQIALVAAFLAFALAWAGIFGVLFNDHGTIPFGFVFVGLLVPVKQVGHPDYVLPRFGMRASTAGST